MQVSVDTVETTTKIEECMMISKLQLETSQNIHLQWKKEQIIKGKLKFKVHIEQNLRPHWTF